MQAPVSSSPQKVPLDKYGYNTIARHISMVLFIALPLFLAAGTWSWGWAWVYTLVSLIGWIVLSMYVAVENPGLLNLRGRPSKEVRANSKEWDLPLLILYTLLLIITPIVAGFDHRYGWTAEVSPVVHIVGLVLLVLGFIPLTWAMAANKFFEPTVRIQPEKGHQVIENGPYRYVRHPGYVGVILHFLAVPLALGSWPALIPAILGTVIYFIRTRLEDNALQQELPGYPDYAKRTRYRLLPGIW
jgi:protein-S-isoprenylcysteine O-methyltransferase Ste14